MQFTTLFSLALAAFTPLTTAAPFTQPPPIKHVGRSVDLSTPTLYQGKTVLKPIHPRAYSAALGLTKRDDISLSDLDLADKVKMIYGTPGEDPSTVLLTHMTLISPNGKRVIMMEQFETFTKEIDCIGTDGEMSLTFKDVESLEYAGKAWGEGGDGFYIIANHDGCAEVDQRKAWLISKVTTNAAEQKVILASEPALWKDVAGKFTLDFGKASISSPAKRAILESRRPHALAEAEPGFFSDLKKKIKSGVNKAVDKVKDVASDVKEGVKDAVDTVKENVGIVKDKVEDKVEEVKDKIEEHNDKVNDKVEEVIDKAKEGIDKAKDKVEEVVDKVKDKTDEILDKSKDKTKEIIEKIHQGAKEVAKAVKEVVSEIGDGDIEQGFTINLSTNTQGQRIPIPNPIPNFPVTATCVDCFVEGTLQFSGRLEVDDFKVTTFEFDALADSLAAKLALEITMTQALADEADLGTDGLTFETNLLPALALPGGLVIEGIFSAGPTLTFRAGLTSSLTGTMSFTLGAHSTLPAGRIHANLVDPSLSTSEGFDNFSTKPVLNLGQLSAKYRLEAFAQPTLGLGFEVLGQIGMEAALKLRAPSVVAEVEAGFKDGGFCEAGGKETGAGIKGTVGLSLGLGVTAKLGGDKTNLVEKELVGLKKELGVACVGIA